MGLEVYIKNKQNHYFAKGIFDTTKTVVLKDSKVSGDVKNSARGDVLKKYREDSDFVGKDFILKEDCIFDSPSAAARFVTGRSVNGYDVWRVSEDETLGQFLYRTKQRIPKKRKR